MEDSALDFVFDETTYLKEYSNLELMILIAVNPYLMLSVNLKDLSNAYPL